MSGVYTLPPAVVVHGLNQARLALAPGRPVLLLSGPAAAGYGGAGWWRALVAAARAGHPGRDRPAEGWAPDALDCGDQAGRALEALHMGCGIIVLDPCPSFAAVVERAGHALVLPARPPALDLGRAGALRHLGTWLGAG